MYLALFRRDHGPSSLSLDASTGGDCCGIAVADAVTVGNLIEPVFCFNGTYLYRFEQDIVSRIARHISDELDELDLMVA